MEVSFKVKKLQGFSAIFYLSGTVNALVQNNIEPVFCDINQTLTMDLEKVKLTKDIKFIVALQSMAIFYIEKLRLLPKKQTNIYFR